MSKIVSLLLVSLMVFIAAAVYDMKYEAESDAKLIARLENDVRAEQEKISRLKAEWSVLTQPARLQDLAERHMNLLKLQPLVANQIVAMNDIAMRPAAPATVASADPIGDLVARLPALGAK